MSTAETNTKEFLVIKHYQLILINTLAKTVDPAHFARRLRNYKALIGEGIGHPFFWPGLYFGMYV